MNRHVNLICPVLFLKTVNGGLLVEEKEVEKNVGWLDRPITAKFAGKNGFFGLILAMLFIAVFNFLVMMLLGTSLWNGGGDIMETWQFMLLLYIAWHITSWKKE